MRWGLFALALAGCIEGGDPFDGQIGTGFEQETDPTGQVFEGEILVDQIVTTDPRLAWELLDPEAEEPLARVFARSPAEDEPPVAAPAFPDSFVERWTFANADAPAALIESGFGMVFANQAGVSCALIDARVADAWGDPLFAEQVLDYPEPSDPDPPLEGEPETLTFAVYQQAEDGLMELRGWYLRLRRPRSVLGLGRPVQDHWLLTEAYELIGPDAGFGAVVLPVTPALSLDAWFEAYAPLANRYATETYSLGRLSEDCSDDP